MKKKQLYKLLSILLSASLVLSQTGIVHAEEAEQTNNWELSPVLQQGAQQTVTLGNANDTTVMQFTPTESGLYRFFSVGGYDTYAYLYDSEKKLLLEDDDSGDNSNFLISSELVAGQTYYFELRHYSLVSEASFDVCLEKTKGITGSELLNGPDRSEYLYGVEYPYLNGVSLRLHLEKDTYQDIVYGDSAWENYVSSALIFMENGEAASLDANKRYPTGRYFWKISLKESGEQITLPFTIKGLDTIPYAVKNNQTIDNIPAAAENWVRVEVAAAGTYEVKVTNEVLTNLSLVDQYGNQVAKTYSSFLRFQCTKAGTYYLRMTNDTATGLSMTQPRVLSKINIVGNPTQNSFFYGLQNPEPTGLRIHIVYTDQTEKDLIYGYDDWWDSVKTFSIYRSDGILAEQDDADLWPVGSYFWGLEIEGYGSLIRLPFTVVDLSGRAADLTLTQSTMELAGASEGAMNVVKMNIGEAGTYALSSLEGEQFDWTVYDDSLKEVTRGHGGTIAFMAGRSGAYYAEIHNSGKLRLTLSKQNTLTGAVLETMPEKDCFAFRREYSVPTGLQLRCNFENGTSEVISYGEDRWWEIVEGYEIYKRDESLIEMPEDGFLPEGEYYWGIRLNDSGQTVMVPFTVENKESYRYLLTVDSAISNLPGLSHAEKNLVNVVISEPGSYRIVAEGSDGLEFSLYDDVSGKTYNSYGNSIWFSASRAGTFYLTLDNEEDIRLSLTGLAEVTGAWIGTSPKKTGFTYGNEMAYPEGLSIQIAYSNQTQKQVTYDRDDWWKYVNAIQILTEGGEEAFQDETGYLPVGRYQWKVILEGVENAFIIPFEVAPSAGGSGEASQESAVTEGKCGENVIWKLYADGEMIISGSGAMSSEFTFAGNTAVCENLQRVKIYRGVTDISLNAFQGASALNSIEINRPDARITGSLSSTSSDFAICGWKESTAESYGQEKKLSFIPLDEMCYLRLEANDGSGRIRNIVKQRGTVPGEMQRFDKTGYVQQGWSLEPGSDFCNTEQYRLSDDMTLYAQWSAREYTLTFDVNGGNALANATKSIFYDKAYGALETPERTGYTFLGWYTEPTGGQKVTSEKICTQDATLYAQWSANSYTLTLEVNGGAALDTVTRSLTFDAAYGTLPVPTRTGYTFLGWYTGREGGKKVTSKTICKGDVTLYAQWSVNHYTLTFDANGGEVLANATKDIAYEDSYGVLEIPVREGYTFLGWYTQGEGGSTVNSGTICTGDATIYAHWSAKNYAIVYDVNGGNPLDKNSKDVTYDSSIGQLAVPVREGYSFLGWYTQSEGGNKVTSKTVCKGAMTIYARWSANSYVLTMDVNGGETLQTSTKSIRYDEAYGTLETPVREGYSFLGWYTQGEGGSRVNAGTICTGDATVYAHWSAKNYLLSYDVNGGKPMMTGSKSITYDKGLGQLAVPERGGYDFLGWYTQSEGGERVSSGTICTGDRTIYAHWSAKTYCLTYDTNGGESLPNSTKSIVYDGIYGTLATPGRTGYTFLGWYTQPEGGSKVNTSTVCTGDVTIYAHWNANGYTLTFDVNGGEVPANPTKSVTFDAAYGTLFTPNRTGYTFLGWYTDAKGGSKVTSATICRGDAVIYAHWRANTYTLTYDVNGGNALEYPTKSIAYDDVYGVLAAPEREGYTFLGWFTESSGGIKINAGTVCDGDATIYAHWNANKYILIYDANGGTEPKNPTKNITYDVAYGTLLVPEREGYDFLGWYTEAEGGKKVSASTICTKDATIYAHWSAREYQLTYEVMGGDALENSGKTIIYDSPCGTLETATRTGYTFLGWYTEATGGSKVDSKTVCKGDITVYARWRANDYILIYDVNGGNPLKKITQSITYDAEYGFLEAPVRTGYTFLGWYTEATGGSKVSTKTICYGDTMLYAHWKANQYTLTYDVNGGQELAGSTKRITYDAAYGELAVPQRTGYTFLGWYTQAEGGTEVTADTVCFGDAIIYAHWQWIMLPAPKLGTISNTISGVNLKWSAVAGAEKYRVYRKEDGSWKKVADVTGLSCTDKKVYSGETYLYTVKCVSADGLQGTSTYDKAGKQIMYVAAPVIQKISATVSGPKVAWNAVAGAEKYRLYRKEAGGSWKRIADTTAVSAIDKTALSGVNYLYTVRCISADGKEMVSAYDTVGTEFLYLKAPTLVSAVASSTRIRVTWEALPEAEGYNIYRKLEDGAWTKIKTITDPSVTSYNDKTAVAGERYHYTVRAYRGSVLGAYDTTGLCVMK